MNAKARIKQLEKTSGLNSGTPKIIFMYDAGMMGMPDDTASFDGVQMTQAEAENKAAAQPDNVLVIHVCYASQAIKDGDE